jgi:UDP:flavonoid glycosyltransferase YjiC (YdhE family)
MKPVRALFAAMGLAGHFNPLLPFLAAFARAGHEVVVAGPPSLEETVRGAGYELRAGAAPPDDAWAAVFARWEHAGSYDEGEAIIVRDWFAGLHAQAMLPALRETCSEWKPDVVMREPYEFASAIAADTYAIPHVRVATGLVASEQYNLELTGPPLETHSPGLVERIAQSPYLTLFPESLDPAVDMFPRIHRFRDVEVAPGPPLPDWWNGDQRPLVYVTFGSVLGGNEFADPVFRAAFAAVAEVPARVLFTVGRNLEIDSLGEFPANVRVEPWVPQADVFPEARLVVCHGGSGTTLGALGAGLPLVIVPMFADQPANAEAVAERGGGIALIPGRESWTRPTLDADRLRDAILEVLADYRYRRVAAGVAAEMRGLPPVDHVVELIAAQYVT